MEIAGLFLHNMKSEQQAWYLLNHLTPTEKNILNKTFLDLMGFSQTGGFNYWVVERYAPNSKIVVRRYTWDRFSYFETVEEVVDFLHGYYKR